MGLMLLVVAMLAVGAVALVAVLRRNDRRIERENPGINDTGGPGFDDDDLDGAVKRP